MEFKINVNVFTESYIETLSENDKAKYAHMCLSAIVQERFGIAGHQLNTEKEYQDTFRNLVNSMKDPDVVIKTNFEQFKLIDMCLNYCMHEEIKVLVEKGVDLNYINFINGCTPLTRLAACIQDFVPNEVLASMDLLISHGADINKRNKDGACISAHLSEAHPEYIIALIDRGLKLSLEEKWTSDPIVVLRDVMPETYLAAKKYIQSLEISKEVIASDKPLKRNRGI